MRGARSREESLEKDAKGPMGLVGGEVGYS